MNIAIWVVQILLALAFLGAGLLKLTQPIDKAQGKMEWVKRIHPNGVQAIGVLEVLGAVGLILPMLTGILPWLTPLAAGGLVLVIIGAKITQPSFKENTGVEPPASPFVFCLIVIYGRLVLVPIV